MSPSWEVLNVYSHSETRSEIIGALRVDMPPVPDPVSLRRVKSMAELRGGDTERGRRWVRHRSLAGAGLVAVAAIAVIALVLTPRADTSAFATADAADALLLASEGSILHLEASWQLRSENDRDGHDPRLDINQDCSYWIDSAGHRMRVEYVNVADGSLDSRTVQVGETMMAFQNNVRYGTGDAQQLVEFNNYKEPFGSVMGQAIDFLRARIAEGSAEPIGTQVIDGEEYWVVEYRAPLAGILTSDVMTATMRTSDYRIHTITRETAYFNLDGRGTESSVFTFKLVEQVQPDALPDDFFSFDTVVAAAAPGTPIEQR